MPLRMSKSFLISCLAIAILSCSPEYTPKQKGYNRIDLPEHEYDWLKGDYPYTFLTSKHAEVRPHNSPYATDDWIDIQYYDFNAEIQITYIPIKNYEMFVELINDAYKLTSKHQVKASSIERIQVNTDNNQAATIYELEGEVPSQVQFYVTDSTDNFLRGALYFQTATKNDSLEPVIDFIKEDVVRLINSLEWKN